MIPSGAPNDSLAIVVGMINDRSGLWQITGERVGLLREHLGIFSGRSRSAAEEMIAIASNGDRFWPTKAEYYAAVSEIKNQSKLVSKDQIEAVIAGVTKGSRVDNVSDKEWVKQAIGILRRISSGK